MCSPRCWRRPSDGRGCVTLVAGEAGIGKTTLVASAAARAAAAGATVAWGHCSDVGHSSPFAPWVEAMARAGVEEGFLGAGTSQVAFLESVLDTFRMLCEGLPFS